MDSARNVKAFSGAIFHVRVIAAFRFRIPPRRKVFEPRLPRVWLVPMKANADLGSSLVEVSGLLIARPRIDGLSRLGRSPGEPSTLPKPGPSEPEKTSKGVPVFARNTLVSVHFLKAIQVARARNEWVWSKALAPFRSCRM